LPWRHLRLGANQPVGADIYR